MAETNLSVLVGKLDVKDQFTVPSSSRLMRKSMAQCDLPRQRDCTSMCVGLDLIENPDLVNYL